MPSELNQIDHKKVDIFANARVRKTFANMSDLDKEHVKIEPRIEFLVFYKYQNINVT